MPLPKSLTAIAAAATFAVMPVAMAPAMAQEASAAAEVTESELDAFVEAYVSVVAIEQEYGARLQDADGEAEQQEIIAEAQTEMTAAVEAVPNIGVDRYIEIIQLAQADPELQAQLADRLEN